MKFTNQATVVAINLEKHPDPDTTNLSVVKLFDGSFTLVVRTVDWQDKKLGVYIPVESLVDTDLPPFSFLKKGDKRWFKVGVMKIRGVYSQGLLVAAPEGVAEGDDVTELFDVKHQDDEAEFDEGMKLDFSSDCRWDKEHHVFSNLSKYDVDSAPHFHRHFVEGEPVVVTEKIHGSNMGVTYVNGAFKVRSRSNFIKYDANDIYWRALLATPAVMEFCKANPDLLVYGEAYGMQKKGGVRFIYDLVDNVAKPVGFRAFDMLRTDRTFVDADDFKFFCGLNEVPSAPVLYVGPYSFDLVKRLAEGKSTLGNHVREGCVVKPLLERKTPKFDRLMFKVIGNGYEELK